MIMYTFHKYSDVPRKYSKYIEKHLREQPDFEERDDLDKYYWSDKNSKSILQDYYPFDECSMIDKKYIHSLYPRITIKTFIIKESNIDEFNAFVKNDKPGTIYYLKPGDKYIGGSKGIRISTNPYELYNSISSNKESYIIQKEVPPMLMDGYKYDIRVYVLVVYNSDIVHIYLYPGILRFCKDKYDPKKMDINRHITITGDFKIMDDINDDIKDIIYPTLQKFTPQKDIVGYQYLGYDIICDKNGKYHIIEINIQPSLERIQYSIIDDFSELVARSIQTNKGHKPYISSTLINNTTLLLTELNRSHLKNLYEITSNITVMKYIGNLKVWDLEKTKRFIGYKNDFNYYFNGIILSGKLIGVIGKNKDKLTIYLNPKYTNKGYGKIALGLYINITEGPLTADVLTSNTSSIQFFKKYKSVIKNNIITFYIR